MKSLLDTIFFRSNNLNYVSKKISELTKKTSAHKIFEAINSYSLESETRYVGGCVRKIIKREEVDDIDLATNLPPNQVGEALKKHNINYYETGIDHGTITAIVDGQTFEITTLREDIVTDGRHAKVKFSKNWKEDSLRRDFTINSIYSDCDGNLFDPHNGKKDIENGEINFIGNPNQRIKEDYLRILRYLRFFVSYSKLPHNPEIIKNLKINISGVSDLSKERLLNELKKIAKPSLLEKLSKDKIGLELFKIIYPELKNIKIFSKIDSTKKKLLSNFDFILLISLMIIDETDNADYFLYRFNISKNDQKRIKIIDNFFKNNSHSKLLTENHMNKIFYYDGKQAVLDILYFKLVKLRNYDKNIEELIEIFKKKITPKMPVGADILMMKYNIPEGKQLGLKLKLIEEEWVKNNFQISDIRIDSIINS
jgi:tRNA nucleotidyltransferase/poly(A) polymerase